MTYKEGSGLREAEQSKVQAEYGHILAFHWDRQVTEVAVGLRDMEAPLGLAGADLLILLSTLAAGFHERSH